MLSTKNSLSKIHSVLLSLAVVLLGLGSTVVAHAEKAARPCDLFGTITPCVAAISTTRSLYARYEGPLYQIRRQSDQQSTDIGVLPDGYANAAMQEKFCAGTICTITKLYDQTPNHNDLTPAPPGGAARGPGPDGYDLPSTADALPAIISGHKIYGIRIDAGMGYRNNNATNTAANGKPEGVYMVTSAEHLKLPHPGNKCCFDFGNAETNSLDNKAGHMDAINIMCRGSDGACNPDGGLDMEDGIYGHLKVGSNTAFVNVMGACDGKHSYAIYQGNAQSGALTSTGVVPLPNGYRPMKQEGAILLGIGGDNSNWATGYFFEGVMTAGMPSGHVMQAVQSNIVAARYDGGLSH